jgi:hypothetical protein
MDYNMPDQQSSPDLNPDSIFAAYDHKMKVLMDGLSAGKRYDDICRELGYSEEDIKRLNEAAEQAVQRIEADKAAYAAMTQEERIEEDKRRQQAAINFITDERLGGP